MIVDWSRYKQEHDINNLSIINAKAKSKWIKAINGQIKGPKSFLDSPSERDRYRARLRRNDEGEVPIQQYIDTQANMKRSSTNDIFDWKELGPSLSKKDGGRTRSLIVQTHVNPPILYAGSVSGGVWKSTDGGLSWIPLTDLMANIAIGCLAQHPSNPNIIYAGTGEGIGNRDARRGAGIFRTSNGGQTWSQLFTTTGPNFRFVNSIYVRDTNIIYSATRSGIYKTTDRGVTPWSLVRARSSGPFTTAFIEMVCFVLNNQDYIFAWEALYGLHVSYDGGITWIRALGSSEYNEIWTRGAISFSPSNKSIGYISVSNQLGVIVGLYKTENYGLNWNNVLVMDDTPEGKINKLLLSNPLLTFQPNNNGANCLNYSPHTRGQGWYDNVISVSPTNPDIVFVGGIDMFRSTDGGKTFQLISVWWINNDTYLHADQHAIVWSPNFENDSTMYVVNDGGVWKSTNAHIGSSSMSPCNPRDVSVSWVPLNEGYATIQFYHGSVGLDGDIIVAGSQDNGSWKYLSNTTWENIDGGDAGYSSFHPNGIMYFTSGTYTTIFRHNLVTMTTNQILSPQQVGGTSVSLFINPFILNPYSPDTIYTCTDRLWKSINTSESEVIWEDLGIIRSGISITSMFISSPTRMYLTGIDSLDVGRFFRVELPNGPIMEVGGSTFCSTCGMFSPSSITALQHNEDIVYVTVSSFEDPHLWVSLDGGDTWANADGRKIPDIPVLDIFIDPSDDNVIYLGTDLGVLFTKNKGYKWDYINGNGLANVPVEKLAYQNSTSRLFCFTYGRGAYVMDLPYIEDAITTGIIDITTTSVVTTTTTTSSITSTSTTGPSNDQTTNSSVYSTTSSSSSTTSTSTTGSSVSGTGQTSTTSGSIITTTSSPTPIITTSGEPIVTGTSTTAIVPTGVATSTSTSTTTEIPTTGQFITSTTASNFTVLTGSSELESFQFTDIFGLYVIIGLVVGFTILGFMVVAALCVSHRKKSVKRYQFFHSARSSPA